MPGVAFFVCGTPSNSRGFEFVELGPERLPATPETYLDKAPADAVECHRIESILIAGQRYVEYSRVLRINPNDAEANRGAYIAVGCLIGQRVAFHTVSNCVDVVSELYGHVCGALTSERSFPIGYRLTDFTHNGSPLGERTAHQCSPLLVADVLLQALNGEGPIDWRNTRQLLLAPGEMIAADISQYQFYSRQGLLGSLTSIDMERAQVHHTAQQTSKAAKVLTDLQHEWASLQGAAERLLTKGEAFRRLTEEIERSVKRDLPLGRAATHDTRADGKESGQALEEPGRGPYERDYRKNPVGNGLAVRVGSHARVGRHGSVRSRFKQGYWLRGSGWAGVSLLVLIGSLLALLTIVALQKFLLPEVAQELAPPPSPVVAEPEPPDGEQALDQPQSDVARERAALDGVPDE